MTFVKYIASRAFITAATLVLAACGGGGSSGAGTSGTTIASSITSTNMQDVGAQGYAATTSLSAQTGGSTSSLVTGVTVDTAAPGLIDAALRGLYRGLSVQPANQVVGVTTSQTISCLGGGSATVTINTASSTTLSAGDSITIDAKACVESGVTLDGKLGFTFKNVTGTPGQSSNWSGSFTIAFTDFSVTSGGDTATASGDMALSITQTSYSVASYSVSGSSLKLSTKMQSGSTIAITLSNFSGNGSLSGNLHTYNTNFTFAGNLNKLGNVTYTVKTLADFKQQLGANNPYQGSLKVTASDNSSLTLTAVDSTNVTLGLDKNGDGTIDETVNTTWAALEARL